MKEIKRNVSLILIAGIIGISLIILLFFYVKINRSTHDIFYELIPGLRSQVILNSSIIRTINQLPVIIIFVYFISFSLLFTLGKFQELSFHFSDIAIPSYTILLVFLAINVFLQLIFIPNLNKNIIIKKYNANISYTAFNKAKEFRKSRKYDKAIDAVNIVFNFDSSNKKALQLYDQINKVRSSAIIEEKNRQRQRVIELPVEPPKGFFERGKLEYKKGNYYAALFYFERALKLHKDNKELQDLYKRCMNKANHELGSLTNKEVGKKRLIKRKEMGLNYLNKKDYYKAYSIFYSLHRRYPEVEDIELYMKTAEKELTKVDFLPSELKKYEWLPGWHNIIFFDKDGYLNTVKNSIKYKNNYFLFGIKRYKINNGISKPLYFKYGKWMNGWIKLKNQEGYYKLKKKDKGKYQIIPYVTPWYLVNSNNIDKLKNQLTIYEVFNLSTSLKKSGFDIQSKLQWLSNKLGLFFALYSITMFIAGFGWSKRSIYEFPPIFKLIMFVIVAPLISYFLYIITLDINRIIIYTYRYFYRFILHSSIINIFIYVLIIEAALSFITTVYFLSQKVE